LLKSHAQKWYHEKYRPQVHFSPKEKWTNDPNGMVYYGGTWHLFFQYYPDSTVWGPMHWGHATSRDLVHWRQEPIALYPDSLGYIFSGSAVVDWKNTSGFGKNGNPPLVAIFTHHDPVRAKAKRTDYQNQSLAFSLDSGRTWTKYAGNPVLKNPGITDFRDPKVRWYAPANKWIMTLATKDRVTFYSSPDLKTWNKESEFGAGVGAHGGVWECPDLFPLQDRGKDIWVLIVNINPGGPNQGSATQYFLGSFDGSRFKANSERTKWLDYGPDEYAGITWSNTGDRSIFLGWMSNWLYANRIPETPWRNAMTIPRELKIRHAGNDILLASMPVRELHAMESTPIIAHNLRCKDSLDLGRVIGRVTPPCRLDLVLSKIAGFSLALSNDAGEELVIGYDDKARQYYIDRARSGKTGFQADFAGRHVAPRLTNGQSAAMTLLIDVSSVELFADNGLTVMSEIFFPEKPYGQMRLQTSDNMLINRLEYASLRSIWK